MIANGLHVNDLTKIEIKVSSDEITTVGLIKSKIRFLLNFLPF